jgi:hypothetical protein
MTDRHHSPLGLPITFALALSITHPLTRDLPNVDPRALLQGGTLKSFLAHGQRDQGPENGTVKGCTHDRLAAPCANPIWRRC